MNKEKRDQFKMNKGKRNEFKTNKENKDDKEKKDTFKMNKEKKDKFKIKLIRTISLLYINKLEPNYNSDDFKNWAAAIFTVCGELCILDLITCDYETTFINKFNERFKYLKKWIISTVHKRLKKKISKLNSVKEIFKALNNDKYYLVNTIKPEKLNFNYNIEILKTFDKIYCKFKTESHNFINDRPKLKDQFTIDNETKYYIVNESKLVEYFDKHHNDLFVSINPDKTTKCLIKYFFKELNTSNKIQLKKTQSDQLNLIISNKKDESNKSNGYNGSNETSETSETSETNSSQTTVTLDNNESNESSETNSSQTTLTLDNNESSETNSSQTTVTLDNNQLYSFQTKTDSSLNSIPTLTNNENQLNLNQATTENELVPYNIIFPRPSPYNRNKSYNQGQNSNYSSPNNRNKSYNQGQYSNYLSPYNRAQNSNYSSSYNKNKSCLSSNRPPYTNYGNKQSQNRQNMQFHNQNFKNRQYQNNSSICTNSIDPILNNSKHINQHSTPQNPNFIYENNYQQNNFQFNCSNQIHQQTNQFNNPVNQLDSHNYNHPYVIHPFVNSNIDNFYESISNNQIQHESINNNQTQHESINNSGQNENIIPYQMRVNTLNESRLSYHIYTNGQIYVGVIIRPVPGGFDLTLRRID